MGADGFDGEAATVYGDGGGKRWRSCVNQRRRGELNSVNQGKIEAEIKHLGALPYGEAGKLDLVNVGGL